MLVQLYSNISFTNAASHALQVIIQTAHLWVECGCKWKPL